MMGADRPAPVRGCGEAVFFIRLAIAQPLETLHRASLGLDRLVETHVNWPEDHRYLNMNDLREHKKTHLAKPLGHQIHGRLSWNLTHRTRSPASASEQMLQHILPKGSNYDSFSVSFCRLEPTKRLPGCSQRDTTAIGDSLSALSMAPKPPFHFRP
jgi:hypothetical protein